MVGGRRDGGVFDTVLGLILKSYNMIAILSRRTDRLASLHLTPRWMLSADCEFVYCGLKSGRVFNVYCNRSAHPFSTNYAPVTSA